MGQDIPQSPLAVYLHIPFCLTRCGYCSFFSLPYRREAVADYHGILLQEIELYRRYNPDLVNADTIYFGGGSPSIMDASQISEICSCFTLSPQPELTLEINPIQITGAFLDELEKTPVNRLSIGLQSTRDEDLIWLQRRHRRAQIKEKIGLLQDKGWENYSLDLIYGLPGQSLSDLARVLDEYTELNPKHISTYLLNLDESCEWSHSDSARLAEYNAISEDIQADAYELIREKLSNSGFIQYEISNFAFSGYESRHNLHYWKSNDYLGLGAGAWGYIDGIRYENPADLGLYEQNLRAGKLFGVQDTGNDRVNDYIMMGMRLSGGIRRDQALSKLGVDLWDLKNKQIKRLSSLGMLITDDDSIRLSPNAYFISNAVIRELTE
ncbi:MAG: coproporphyrinogen III oxidase [Candidatus Cloacimonetes bacterium HGW-Cloacimonetes-2]|jgi:oxygen-independent coproporphyrinogen-3 oxidase|nr:MAG: coproporphyrinogen III oxidase [Candidatus Cloacimonetes bacterium HGW-Cloacimonetes-2]